MKPRMGAVTIYSVAERAGVSISTVSLVMNAPHRVSPATRERVVAAAAELGYRRRADHRSEPGQLRVAVAAPFSSYPSYYRRLTGMLARARDTTIDLMVHDLDSAAAADSPLLDALPARPGVDGVIVMGVPLSPAAVRASRAAGLPVVLVDVRSARPRGGDLPGVLVDDLLGGRLLGEHLRERGHDRVLFVHEPQLSRDYVSAGMLRAEGVAESLALDEVAVAPDDGLERVVRALAASGATAVVANHDALAVRVHGVLRASGRRIPEDVALAGYDDGDLAAGLGLTTVRQPFEESGRAAIDLLLAAIAGEGASISRVDLAPSLVVRATT